jgi:hypothetical protein
MELELTYQDVAEHNTKKDIYVVIHDKIYDVTKFIDEHPCVAPSSPDLTIIFITFASWQLILLSLQWW